MSVYAEMNAARRSMAELAQRLKGLRQDAGANAEEIKKLRAEYEILEEELSCLESDAKREAEDDERDDREDYDVE
jgi:regulator of replication initiation timing